MSTEGSVSNWPGDLPTFAERLRYLVKSKQMTQQRFAEECGISQAALEKYLRGGAPSTDAVIKICGAQQVSADWLLCGRVPTTTVSRGFVRHLLIKAGERLLEETISQALSSEDPRTFLAEQRWCAVDQAQKAAEAMLEDFDEHAHGLRTLARIMPEQVKE